MQIQDQFNRISASYDGKRRLFIPCFDSFYAETTEFLARCIKAPNVIIDLGAGTGLLSSFWYRHFPSARFVLVDIADAMLNRARQRFSQNKNISFKIGDYAESLPDVDIDVAISALSIHHLDEGKKTRLFKNIYDRLPSGGLFVNYDQFLAADEKINAWYSAYWENGLYHNGLTDEDLALWRERKKLDRECSVKDEIKMLNDSGFDSVECVFSSQKFSVIAAVK